MISIYTTPVADVLLLTPISISIHTPVDGTFPIQHTYTQFIPQGSQSAQTLDYITLQLYNITLDIYIEKNKNFL